MVVPGAIWVPLAPTGVHLSPTNWRSIVKGGLPPLVISTLPVTGVPTVVPPKLRGEGLDVAVRREGRGRREGTA